MTEKTTVMRVLLTSVDKLSPTLKAVSKEAAIAERRLKAFSAGGMVMGAGIAAGAGIAIKSFADVEQAEAKLKSAMMQMGGVVPKSFEQLHKLAEQLGDKLPGTTADMERMMEALVKNGTTPEDILNGVGTATAYLGVKLGMATDQAATFAAKLKSATNATAPDMMKLLDVIQRLEGVGLEPEKQLSAFSAMKPILHDLQLQGSAAAKALAPLLVMNKEVHGETVGIAVSKIVALGLNAKKVKEVNEKLAKGGINLDFTNGKGAFGGMENLFAQMQKLRKLTPQQFKTIMPKLFGDDAQTLQVLESIVRNDYQTYQGIQKTLMDQATLQEKVGSELGTLQNKWEASTGTFTNLMATFGKLYEGDVKGLVDQFGELSAKLRTFTEQNPQTIKTIIAMASAIAGIKVAALAAAFGVRMLSLTMMASPMGLFITALAAGAAAVIENWDTVGPFFQDLFDRLSKGWQAVKTDWDNTINGLAKTWEDTKTAIFDVWDAIERRWDDLVSGFKAGLQWLHLGSAGGMQPSSFQPSANTYPRGFGASPAMFGGDVEAMIAAASKAHGVDPALIRSIIKAESGGNPNAVSPVGAGGIMQMMPATAKRFGVKNRFDPAQNIMGGTAYLAFLLNRYHGDERKAVAGYNAGEGAVDKYGGVPPYRETQGYVSKVLRHLQQQRIQGGIDITFNNPPAGTRIDNKAGSGPVKITPKVGYRTLGMAGA